MKQIFLAVWLFFVAMSPLEAQILKKMVITPDTDDQGGVFLQSCNSPTLGMVVFKTAIRELQVDMYPPSQLVNIHHNAQRNEYVLCVHPTHGRYRVTITCEEFDALVFFVEDVRSNQAKIFTLNEKQTGGNIKAEEYNALGNESYRQKKYVEAEQYYRQAVEMEPDETEYIRNTALACFMQRKDTEAEQLLLRANSISPANAQFNHTLGTIYFDQRKYEKAIEHFKNAVDLETNSVVLPRYRNDLQRAINASPEKMKTLMEMGDDLYEQGKYIEAINYYRQASSLDRDNNIIKQYIADAEMQKRQRNYMITAADNFKKAQDLRQGAKRFDDRRLNQVKRFYESAIGHVNYAPGDKETKRTLPPDLEELASIYVYEHEHFLRNGKISVNWLNNFLFVFPYSPLREEVEKAISKSENSKSSRR